MMGTVAHTGLDNLISAEPVRSDAVDDNLGLAGHVGQAELVIHVAHDGGDVLKVLVTSLRG